MAGDPEKHRLSEADHQRIFETQIRPRLFAGAAPAAEPVAIIFGGQPGAGKSASLAAAGLEFQSRGGAVEIIGDDLRAFHPQYMALMAADDRTAAFYTDRDSGKWVEKAIDFARANRYNVIIEGTYRNSDVVASTMNGFRAAGYQVDARALAVNAQFSAQGIIERYEMQRSDRGSGRMTTPEAHQAAYDGMPLTIGRIERERLADRLTIYRRGAEVVYSNELEQGRWLQPPTGRQELEAERARPWTDQERQSYAEAWARIDAFMTAAGRNATSSELEHVRVLRQQGAQALTVTPRPPTPYAEGKESVKVARHQAGPQNALQGVKPSGSDAEATAAPKGPSRRL